MLEPLSTTILISIGILLVVIEILFTSFFILWFGLGFLIVAFIGVLFPISTGEYQLALVAVISILLLYFLKDKFRKVFFKNDGSVKDDFLNEQGEGIVKDGLISFKGTLWEYQPKLDLKEGMVVKVLEAKNNMVKIELI